MLGILRLAVVVIAAALTGCAANEMKAGATVAAEAPQEQPSTAPAAKSQETTDPRDEIEKAEKERRDLVRKQARTQRELDMARERLRKTRMQNEFNAQQRRLAHEKAAQELELAERKLKSFKDLSVPERLDRADLSLQWSRDSALEARQELEQLEGMYKEDEFADETKEIVLERGRRRLERAQRSLALEDRAIATLKSETLPVELIEQEAGVREKREALRKLAFDHEMEAIDEKLSILSGDAELIRLEEDLEDVARDLKDFDRKAAEKAKKAAEEAASQPSSEGGR